MRLRRLGLHSLGRQHLLNVLIIVYKVFNGGLGRGTYLLFVPQMRFGVGGNPFKVLHGPIIWHLRKQLSFSVRFVLSALLHGLLLQCSLTLHFPVDPLDHPWGSAQNTNGISLLNFKVKFCVSAGHGAYCRDAFAYYLRKNSDAFVASVTHCLSQYPWILESSIFGYLYHFVPFFPRQFYLVLWAAKVT